MLSGVKKIRKSVKEVRRQCRKTPWELYLIGGISSAGTVSPCKLHTVSGCWGSFPVAQGRLQLEITTVEVFVTQLTRSCREIPKLLVATAQIARRLLC